MELLRQLFQRTFVPTWVATALLIAVQMCWALFLYEPPEPRAATLYTADVLILALIVVGTGIAVWAFRAVRAMTLLTGSLVVTVLALDHAVVPPHLAPPPPEELFAFYTVAAVLLAVGAVLEAQRR